MGALDLVLDELSLLLELVELVAEHGGVDSLVVLLTLEVLNAVLEGLDFLAVVLEVVDDALRVLDVELLEVVCEGGGSQYSGIKRKYGRYR